MREAPTEHTAQRRLERLRPGAGSLTPPQAPKDPPHRRGERNTQRADPLVRAGSGRLPVPSFTRIEVTYMRHKLPVESIPVVTLIRTEPERL